MNRVKGSQKINFFKSFVGFSMSSWVSALLSLISTPIITRVFSTEEYGKIALFISIVNIILNFAYLGVDQAFARFYNEPLGNNNKKSMMGVCLAIVGVLTTIISFAICLYYKKFSVIIIGYETLLISVCIVLSVVANVVFRFFNLSVRMEKNIILFNIQTIVMTVINNISYVFVAIYIARAEYAIALRTILTFLFATFFFFYSGRKILSFKADYSKSVIADLLFYALPVCPAAVLFAANSSVGQILMKRYVDYEAIGIYSNAVTISSILGIIKSGINNYWIPYVFENYKTNQKQIMKMHHMISLIMVMSALGIVFFQDLIYSLLVGKNFWDSKQLFPLLLISSVCYTISETLGIGIQLSKNTLLNIPVYLVSIVVNVGLCYLLLPEIGVLGAALATAFSGVAMLILKAFLGERRYRCSDNYTKLIIALGVLVCTAFIHIFVYKYYIKYFIYLFAMFVVMLVYRDEIKMITELFFDIISKFRNDKEIKE